MERESAACWHTTHTVPAVICAGVMSGQWTRDARGISRAITATDTDTHVSAVAHRDGAVL